MAQIRKFSNGGGSPEASTTKSSNESPKKPYKLTIDGKTFELDDDDIYRWSQSMSSDLSAVGGQAFQDVINAIKRGTNVHYNSATNTFSGVNFSNKDIVDQLNANRTNPNQKQAARQLKNWAKRAYRKGDIRQDWMVDTAKFMKYNFGQPTQQTQESTDTPKTSLFGSYGNFQYETDDQGNTSWSQSPLNASALQLLNEYQNLGTLSREDAFNRYNMDETKYNQFMDWYNTYGQNYDWNALRTRIQNKRFDPYDNELLELLGWNVNTQESKTKTTAHQPEGLGFDEDYLKQNNLYIRQGDDGHYYLTQGAKDANGNITYTPVTDTYNLMDWDWATNTAFANGSIVGGRFYNQDDTWNQNTAASREMQRFRDVANLTHEDGTPLSPEEYRQALLETGIKFAGMDQPSPFSLYYDPTKHMLDGFGHITAPIYYTDLTSNFNMPEGQQVIGYVNPTERDAKTGRYKSYYAVSDDPNAVFDTQEKLQNYLNDRQITSVTGVRDSSPKVTQYDVVNYNNQQYRRASKKAKVQEGNEVKDVDIYRGDDGKYYYFGANQELYPIYNIDLLNKITKGEVISSQAWLNDAKAENRVKWFKRIFGDPGVSVSTTYKPTQFDALLGFKKGGKISVLQYGGLFLSGSNKIKTREKSDDRVGKLHTISNGPSTQDASDKWAKAATALDVGSGALALTGIGNVAAGLAGLGGTAARFVSDIKRDGLDAGDIGRLGLNLGLDLLTLIPFAGSAAKAAKIAKAGKDAAKFGKNVSKLAETTKKTEQLISTADVLGDLKVPKFLREPGNKIKKAGRFAEITLPTIGTVQAAGATINAAKDGEITTDEMATIANGLISGALLRRGISRKLDRAALKAVQNKLGIQAGEQTFKATLKKADGTNVKISVNASDLIGKRKKEIQNILDTKIKDAGVDLDKSGIKAEDLIKKFNIPFKDGVVSKIRSNWNKADIAKQKKLDVFDEEALKNNGLYKTLTQNNLGYWENRAARAYQYGLIRNPEAHEYITNRFKASVIPQNSNPFSINPLQWSRISKQDQMIGLNAISQRNRANRKFITTMFDDGIKSVNKAKSYISSKADLTSEQKQYWLDLINNKQSGFADLINKVSRLKTGPDYKGQRRLLIDAFKSFKQGGKIIKAQNGDWTGYWGDPTKAFNQNIDTRPFPLRIPTSTTSSTSQPYTLVMNNTNTNPYFDYERGGIKFDSNGNVDWKATYDTNSDYMKYRQYYIDNWNNDSFKDVKQAYLNQLVSKGRKSGTVPMDMSLDEFMRITNDKRLGYAHDLYTDAFANAYPTAPQIDTNIELPAEEELQVDASSPVTGSTDVAPIDYVDSTGKIIPGSAWSGLRADEYTPKLRGWNPDDLIGGIELARSLAMNTAMFNNYKKANKLIQKEMPTEIYDRYQDHITPIFNEQARNKRQFFVPTSTDALTNYAMRQTNEDAARQLEMEGKLRASEAYSQYLDKDLAARRAYAEDRRNTAFFNRQEMANKLMRDAQIDMQRKLANNQSIQNAVMEFRNKLNQDWNRRQNFMQQEDAIKGAQAYDVAIKKYLADNGYNNQWNALSDEDKRTYGDIQNWLSQTNYSAWNDMMTGAGNARINYMRGTYNNYLQYPWSRIRYAKKGTKTPTYLQRHTGQKPDEAIWIQRNKDTAKAIEKLHDAVIKLFMKSIS